MKKGSSVGPLDEVSDTRPRPKKQTAAKKAAKRPAAKKKVAKKAGKKAAKRS